MEIWKFGGSCLTGPDSYVSAVGAIARADAPGVIVVSAMRGVTDRLQLAVDGETRRFDEILDLYRSTWRALSADKDGFRVWESRLESARSISGDGGDAVLAWGDECSASLLVEALLQAGRRCIGMDSGALGLITDSTHRQARPSADARARIAATVAGLEETAVVPGFVGADPSGRRTTLGRNTSDYSAALIAAAVDASALRIFSDTGGILSADPSLVENARRIDRMAYEEVGELIHAGAPVLHPLALAAAADADVPIILQALDGEAEARTLVTRAGSAEAFYAFPHSRGLSLVELRPGPGVEGAGLLGPCHDRLCEAGVHIEMSSASDSTVLIAAMSEQPLDRLLQPIIGAETVRVTQGFAVVSIVGRRVAESEGLPARSLTALAGRNVYPQIISDGGSAPRLAFLVEEADLGAAVTALHEAFSGSEG